MAKSIEEKREYNRIKMRESRERKKEKGLPLNTYKTDRKATMKYLKKKKRLLFTISDNEYNDFSQIAEKRNVSKNTLFKLMLHEFKKNN